MALWLAGSRYRGPLTAPPLPAGGSLGEQPAALLDALALLDSWVSTKEREQ